MTRRLLAALCALLIWFALGLQLVLMVQNNPQWTAGYTITQFFSYFTILTNLMAAIYFSAQALNAQWSYRPGVLTALTGYILIVGITYQFLLRHIWSPQGWNQVADELLHSVNPLLPLIWWLCYERKREVHYRQLPPWLIYPLAYLIYILIRGSMEHWYPYPFVDVNKLGLQQTLVNSAGLLLVFIVILLIMIAAGRGASRGRKQTGRIH